jgi:hypothetical protein
VTHCHSTNTVSHPKLTVAQPVKRERERDREREYLDNPKINYVQVFIYSPTDAPVSCLKKNFKIYIKIYIKTAPTRFGVTVTPSSGSALICAY